MRIMRVLVAAAACVVPAHGALAARAKGEQSARQAQRILKLAGVRGGLIVHVGCGPSTSSLRSEASGSKTGQAGELTAALRANDRYLVHGLDRSPANVAKAREHIRSLGLYGPVSVDRFGAGRLPYTDNLVNLVVCGNPDDVPMAEVLRVLAPRGVACIRRNGEWTRTVKPWPGDIDEWTHFFHGSDNNAVARDTRVGPPRHLQWKAAPMWCRSHEFTSSIASMVTAKGRMCYVVDEGIVGQPRGVPALWRLVARDAFSGVLLWKRPLPGHISTRSLVAMGDKLYVAPGRRHALMILDAATGETLKTCSGARDAAEIVATPGAVVVSVRRGTGSSVVAVHPDTGEVRWTHKARGLLADTLAARDGRVCYHNGREVVCRGLDDGKELWRAASKSGRGGMLIMQPGAVLFTASAGLQALAPDTGRALWKGPRVGGRPPNFFVADGLVWRALAGGYGRSFLWTPQEFKRSGYDPVSGEVKRTVEVARLITPGHHYRCYPPKATDRYLLLHKRGVEFVDLRGDNHMRHNWLRAPCRHGVVPANGLLYVPPSPCFCYPGVLVSGFNALAAGLQDRPEPKRSPAARLERGRAYGRIGDRKPWTGNSPWPMYRHDPRRSGRAGCALPAGLKRRWQVELGGALTPPVVADGRLCIADTDAHTVHCLDARSGKPLWRYAAGGRVDSAPTFHKRLVLFGSADGWVYCLRAADGELVWRFHAAPAERRIVAFGQVESAWPVHGSVMVHDDPSTGSGRALAYVTAGRSSYVDGGIRLYALRPETGEVVHKSHVWSGRPDVTKDAGRPFDIEGCRSDILVSDGADLYMLQMRFASDLTSKPAPRITKLGDREVGLHLMCQDGFLDKTWFNRTYWTYSRRWPGYYFSYKGPKSGQILVFDDTMTYGLHVFSQRRGHSPEFAPGTDGYELFADRNSNEPVLPPTEIGREKGLGYFRSQLPKWTLRIPVRVQAMVLSPSAGSPRPEGSGSKTVQAGEHLFVAGLPDVVPVEDPMAAFEGRMGSRLWVVSAADGKKLTEYKLDSVPVFDGMIAAEGRLYLATTGGRIVCMTGQ